MKHKQRTHGTFEQTLAPLLFLSPNLVIFVVFIIVPAVMGLRMSFYDMGFAGGSKFVGFANFAQLAADPMFWRTLVNTFIYVGVAVPLIVLIALALALPLSSDSKGMGFFRSLFYLPSTLSLIIVGIAWRWILGFDLGIANYLLKLVNLKPIPWLIDGAMAQTSLIFVTIWTRVGYFMMMLIGGLQAIPSTYYEAARMDGASSRTILKRITIPLLKPMLLVVTVLATVESFKAYDLIYVMTQGGPGSATKFLVQYIYQVAFEEDRLGYGSAISMVLLFIIGIFTVFQFSANREEYTNE
jgi:alpha-1,4-digalacturonate transport system permease protein